MKYIFALICGAPLLAQTTLPGGSTPTAYVLQQNFTSGMIGFTTGQTARLNVFNLNPVLSTTAGSSTTTTPANCTIEIQFLDNNGVVISQYVVPNFAPLGDVTGPSARQRDYRNRRARRDSRSGEYQSGTHACGFAGAGGKLLCIVDTGDFRCDRQHGSTDQRFPTDAESFCRHPARAAQIARAPGGQKPVVQWPLGQKS